MRIKIGVDTNGVQPQTWYAVGVFEALYFAHGERLVVTSLTDGIHPDAKNVHGRGLAADLRIAGLSPGVLDEIVKQAEALLFPLGFDVVLEADHIHVEFDPKPTRSQWTLTQA